METSQTTIEILEEVKKLTRTFRVGAAAARADNNGVFSPFLADGITWHGQFRCKPGQNIEVPYFRDRDELSNASYKGDWVKAMAVLAHGREVHKQVWINCWRICMFLVPLSEFILIFIGVLLSVVRSYRKLSKRLYAFASGSLPWSSTGDC